MNKCGRTPDIRKAGKEIRLEGSTCSECAQKEKAVPKRDSPVIALSTNF